MEIGGVWDLCVIGQTTSASDGDYTFRDTERVMQKKGWPKIASKNKFGDLQDSDDEEDSDEDEIKIEPPPGLPKGGFERIPRKKWKKIRVGDEDVGLSFRGFRAQNGVGDEDAGISFRDFRAQDCGDCDICPVESKDIKMSLRFEVADVKKPLIAVRRIC